MNKNFLLTWLLTLAVSLPIHQAVAQTLVFTSGPSQVHLLELYTSQGCSSCPPADDWMSELTADSRLWRQVIPVAFHVDYWNYLGWRDRFSSPRYSARQRSLASAGKFQVYTPGFVLNGAEWRRGYWRRRLELPPPATAGELTLTREAGTGRLSFVSDGLAAGTQLVAHLVLLGFDLQTSVSAGENFGRTLANDFVALSYEQFDLRPQERGWLGEIDWPRGPAGGVAAWVVQRGASQPLQAVGGWLN